MTIKFNGVDLSLQPTRHRWIPKDVLGKSGAGQPFYSAVQEYELEWEVMSPAEFQELCNEVAAIGVSGTTVVDLPQYCAATYTFYSYSGCIVNAPIPGDYFAASHITDVRLLISNIRV